MTVKRSTLTALIVMVSVTLVLSLIWAEQSPAQSTSPKPAAISTPLKEWPKSLRITSGVAGTTIGVYATGVAKVIETYMKIPTSPEGTTGVLEGTALLIKGQSHLAITNSPGAGYALRNQAPFPPDSSKILRGLLVGGYFSQGHWVTLASSDIGTFKDFKGKRLMCARAGEPVFEDIWRATIECHGMTEKDVVIMPELGVANQNTALKEKRADAALMYGKAPVPGLLELQSSNAIRIMSYGDAERQCCGGKLPWIPLPSTIPAGTYKDQDKDLSVLGFAMGVTVRKDLPDDMVYAIAKTIDENLAELKAIHPSFKTWTMKELANDPFVPYHAGAYKYYKEKGYLTQESMEKQKSLLDAIGEKR